MLKDVPSLIQRGELAPFDPTMRWACDRQGCFNIKMRPKIEYFSECFPRNIGMGDIDGVVELDGRFLWLEWKKPGAMIPKAQERMYEQLKHVNSPSSLCGVMLKR